VCPRTLGFDGVQAAAVRSDYRPPSASDPVLSVLSVLWRSGSLRVGRSFDRVAHSFHNFLLERMQASRCLLTFPTVRESRNPASLRHRLTSHTYSPHHISPHPGPEKNTYHPPRHVLSRGWVAYAPLICLPRSEVRLIPSPFAGQTDDNNV
jgi:hypothetical protein